MEGGELHSVRKFICVATNKREGLPVRAIPSLPPYKYSTELLSNGVTNNKRGGLLIRKGAQRLEVLCISLIF